MFSFSSREGEREQQGLHVRSVLNMQVLFLFKILLLLFEALIF